MIANLINFIGVLIDPIVALALFLILIFDRRVFLGVVGYKLACALAISGLLGQAVWSWGVLSEQSIPSVETMPWWVGKDLGYLAFVLTYILKSRFRKNEKNSASAI